MFKLSIVVGALALAGAWPSVALAQGSDLDEIRKQIQELKDAYEARIQGLEKRLKAAEDAANAKAAAEQTPAAQAAAPPETAPTDQQAGIGGTRRT